MRVASPINCRPSEQHRQKTMGHRCGVLGDSSSQMWIFLRLPTIERPVMATSGRTVPLRRMSGPGCRADVGKAVPRRSAPANTRRHTRSRHVEPHCPFRRSHVPAYYACSRSCRPPFCAYPRSATGSPLRARWDPLRVGGLPLTEPKDEGQKKQVGPAAGLEPATFPPLLSCVSTISVVSGGSIRLSYAGETPLPPLPGRALCRLARSIPYDSAIVARCDSEYRMSRRASFSSSCRKPDRSW